MTNLKIYYILKRKVIRLIEKDDRSLTTIYICLLIKSKKQIKEDKKNLRKCYLTNFLCLYLKKNLIRY